MTELPSGWELVQLSDVVQPSSLKAEPGEFPSSKFVGLEHIESGTNQLLGTATTQNIKSTKSVFCAGDVLYGKLRPYLRKVCRPDFAGVCSTDILVFPATDTLDNGYLLHFLSRQETADYASRNASGINIPRINPQVLGRIDFPLPPLAEQQRIAAKVSALQRRILGARDVLAKIRPLLERFKEAVLAAAFRGTLSAERRYPKLSTEPGCDLLSRIRLERRRHWKEAVATKAEAGGQKSLVRSENEYAEPEPLDEAELPDLPAGWCWAAAEEIVEPGAEIVYGIVQPGEHVADGVPYVRAKDIQGGAIRINELRRTSRRIAQTYERAALKGGDVLLGIIRATKVAIVPDELTGGNITQGTARFRPSAVIRTRFLAHWLGSPFAQAWLQDRYRGIDMPGLNLRDVRRLPVPLAPLDEQKMIEDRLDAVSASIATMDYTVVEALERCHELHQAVLAKAFRGALLPQKADDEPAAGLLVRIAERREAAAMAEKEGKGARKVAKMKKAAKGEDLRERLLEWIAGKRGTEFTFEEVRQGVPAEYESLKEAIFGLLGDERGTLRQVFNETTEMMQLRSGEQ